MSRIYDIDCVDIPNTFSTADEYHRHLLSMIDVDREGSLDLLYRSVYKFILKQLYKYEELDSVENLICYGSITFMKTVESYDLEGNVPFLGYYSICLRNEIYNDYLERKMENGKVVYEARNEISIDEPICDNQSLLDILESNEPIDLGIMYKETLGRVFGYIDNMNVKEEHKKIFKYYLRCNLRGESVSYEKIGLKFNMTRSGVCRVISKVKNILIPYLEND